MSSPNVLFTPLSWAITFTERTALPLQHSTYSSDLNDSWINLCCATNNAEGCVLLGLDLQTALKNINKIENVILSYQKSEETRLITSHSTKWPTQAGPDQVTSYQHTTHRLQYSSHLSISVILDINEKILRKRFCTTPHWLYTGAAPLTSNDLLLIESFISEIGFIIGNTYR